MIFFWKGWGISVFVLFVFWVWVGIGLLVGFSPYEPDKHKAMMDVEWAFAGLFALHALSVWAVVQYRGRRVARAMEPSVVMAEPILLDEFMFVPLVYWPYILFAVVVLFAGAATFGYALFD